MSTAVEGNQSKKYCIAKRVGASIVEHWQEERKFSSVPELVVIGCALVGCAHSTITSLNSWRRPRPKQYQEPKRLR